MKDQKTTSLFDYTLESWIIRCQNARDGHYKSAERLFNLSQRLGYILIYSTVFVTTFSFFTHTQSYSLFWGITTQHIVIFVGCIAAVISGIVAQARYGERAETHRSSGSRYANLARDFEELRIQHALDIISCEALSQKIGSTITEWNSLSENSLLTPHKSAISNWLLNVAIAMVFSVIFFFIITGHQWG